MLLFHPAFLQTVTNDSVVQKSKRSPSVSFDLDDSPSVRSSSFIDWHLSLGNATYADFESPTLNPTKQYFRNKVPWRPKVTVIGDNLAVNVSWPSRNSQEHQLSHYRIRFRYREPHELRWVRPFIVVQTHLLGSASEPYMYVTNEQPGGLEAGKVYQFQVAAVCIDAEAPEEKSQWSFTTSFDYISPEPPLVRVARRLTDESVHIKWSRPWRQSGFKVTRFIILFRREKRLPGWEMAFHGFQYSTAPGNLEEYTVMGLDRSSGYQFVVYGDNTPVDVDPSKSLFTGGLHGRKITAFSQEVFVPVNASVVAFAKDLDSSIAEDTPVNAQPVFLDMSANASNFLMFLILGVLAGAMLVVMVLLVAICFFRQRREKIRLLAQVIIGDKAPRSDEVVDGTAEGDGSCTNKSVGSKAGGGEGLLFAESIPIPVANFRTALAQPTSVADGHGPPLLPASHLSSPLPPPPPMLDPQSSRSSIITLPEFKAAVVDMKREPPSGGSMHEESDDNIKKHANRMAMLSTQESVFFTQHPYNLNGHLLPDFHLYRHPPSPSLESSSGPIVQQYTRSSCRDFAHGYSRRKVIGGWGANEEVRRSRLGILGSQPFAYHHAVATEWSSHRRTSPVSTNFFLANPDFSSPPQRIQAIVPQAEHNEVNKRATEMANVLNLNGGTLSI